MAHISFSLDSTSVKNRIFQRPAEATAVIPGGTRYQQIISYQVPIDKKAIFTPNLTYLIQNKTSPIFYIKNFESFSCSDFLNPSDSVIAGVYIDVVGANTTFLMAYIVNSVTRYSYTETFATADVYGGFDQMSVTYSAIELDK